MLLLIVFFAVDSDRFCSVEKANLGNCQRRCQILKRGKKWEISYSRFSCFLNLFLLLFLEIENDDNGGIEIGRRLIFWANGEVSRFAGFWFKVASFAYPWRCHCGGWQTGSYLICIFSMTVNEVLINANQDDETPPLLKSDNSFLFICPRSR